MVDFLCKFAGLLVGLKRCFVFAFLLVLIPAVYQVLNLTCQLRDILNWQYLFLRRIQLLRRLNLLGREIWLEGLLISVLEIRVVLLGTELVVDSRYDGDDHSLAQLELNPLEAVADFVGGRIRVQNVHIEHLLILLFHSNQSTPHSNPKIILIINDKHL